MTPDELYSYVVAKLEELKQSFNTNRSYSGQEKEEKASKILSLTAEQISHQLAQQFIKFEDIVTFLTDPDERICILMLLSAYYGQTHGKLFCIVPPFREITVRHPSRWFRQIAMYYFFRTGMITVSAPVAEMYTWIARTAGGGSAPNWKALDQGYATTAVMELAGYPDPYRNSRESTYLPGVTRGWFSHYAAPILETLVWGKKATAADFKSLDPNITDLHDTIQLLVDHGVIRQGGRGKEAFELVDKQKWFDLLH